MANIDGGTSHINYVLMPLTAEETSAGGEYLGRRYAIENKDRWINVDHLVFELQTYDRGYTKIHVNGKTYLIHQDIIENDISTRIFIGKDVGMPREDDIGGIQTVENFPKYILTWKQLVALGVVVEGANLVINYTKLLDDQSRCVIGNVSTGGLRLVIPAKTTTGEIITDICTNDEDTQWYSPSYPAKYICDVVLPEGLTSIGLNNPAFPELGRNVVRHTVHIKIPSTVTTIGEKAFYGSKVESVSGSKLNEFTANDKLETIKKSAFENCTELSVIHFGPVLKTIEEKAFANCKKAKLFFRNTIESVADDACLLVGDVEYTPRIKKGEEIPAVVSKAPFQAKLWNGKIGHTPGFYKKPERPPYHPPIIPGGGGSETERTPLDLGGVIDQINGLSTVTDNISVPK